MDPAVAQLVDISQSEAAMRAAADMMLERARWASQVFQRYDRERTYAIAEAAAKAAHAKAGEYGDWAVKETGFGVAEHKKLKNELSSLPFVEHYRDWDFVGPRLDELAHIIEIPKPAGVVFALVPSTNPIATVYFKVLSALMTRNAIVLCPHPAARECSIDAVRTLAEAAEAAGAPEAVIQVIEQPNIPLINEFMQSEKTDVILATGGTAMVRAAYSSSNPAIGVGPGNAPVLVDGSADIAAAARHIVDSKSFDNSVLCTNESVLLTLDTVAVRLMRELGKAGAHICSGEETEALRGYLFHERGFNVEAVGRDAGWIAEQAGIKVNKRVKVLVTPISSDRCRRGPVTRKTLPGARASTSPTVSSRRSGRRGRFCGSQAPVIRRRSTRPTIRSFSNMPRQSKSTASWSTRPAVRAHRALRPTLRHLHRRHRLLRPVLDRRECRAAASRQLDQGRLAQGNRRRPRCVKPVGPAPSRSPAQGPVGRRARPNETQTTTRRRAAAGTICANRSARSLPKNSARS